MRLSDVVATMAILLVRDVQAHLGKRDDSSSCDAVDCNAPGCYGVNDALGFGTGYCTAGSCAGLPCMSVCPTDGTISCSDSTCVGLYGGNDDSWACGQGDYAGCSCQNTCPAQMPSCSDSACIGTSNPLDAHGICTTNALADCLCTNNCPSNPVSCSSDSCQGINNPNGGNSVCTFGSSAGCPCVSKCKVDFCDVNGCNGYNTLNGAAHCTAGEYAGCYCTSLCPLKPAAPLSCTDPGCAGLNNLGGHEFCTAGKYQGCKCTSACPSSQPACSSCDGQDGICTAGAAYGCACSGGSSKRTVQDSKTRRDASLENNPIQSSQYIVASPGSGADDRSAQAYRRDQVQRALYDGILLYNNGETVISANGARYPAPFYVTGPGLTTIRASMLVGNPNDLIQWPIIKDVKTGEYLPFGDGIVDGADRVVFHATTGGFAGIISHRGEEPGFWHAALATDISSDSSTLKAVALSTLNQNPYPWFAQLGEAWTIPLMPGTVTNTTTPSSGAPVDCPNAETYQTLDDVLADASFPDVCMNMYMLSVLSRTLSGALANYTTLMNDGYESNFGFYTKYVREQAKLAWENVWSSKGQNTYWNCFDLHGTVNESIACGGFNHGSDYFYVFKDYDSFCRDMNATYNLDCSWVIPASELYFDPTVSGGSSCQKEGINCPVAGTMYFYELNTAFPIADPGAAITQALSNYTGLSNWLSDSAVNSELSLLWPLEADVVDGAATTVFTVQAAVQAMQQVSKIGETEKEEEKKETILAFIMAFLLVLPGVGEITEGVDILAEVAQIARLADLAGNTALSLYGVVEDPNSAPMAIAQIIFGAVGLRDEASWGKAAAVSRAMGEDVIESMGETVAEGMAKVKSAVKECK